MNRHFGGVALRFSKRSSATVTMKQELSEKENSSRSPMAIPLYTQISSPHWDSAI
ncbi:hypothetical protein CI102_2599 [Trichoderma harzianum]|nr:hypothetical protein CI102_2599 [Trichoderma harzianum]